MMSIERTALLLLTVSCTFTANSAKAASIRFCFKGAADFVDSELQPSGARELSDGSAEHYWNDPSDFQLLRGIHVSITRTGAPFTILWSGYTGDGVGSGATACTGYFTVAVENGQTYEAQIDTYGRVQGNIIKVDHLDGISASKVHTIARTLGVETYNIDSSDSRLHQAYRVYNGAAFSIYRHAAGVYNATYQIYTGMTTCPSPYDPPQFCSAEGSGYYAPSVYLTNGAAARKSYISHELGHDVMDHAIAWGWGYQGDSSWNDPVCPSGTGHNHRIDTEEYQHDAMVEGLAHFYSADVWNNHSASACAFQYYAPTHNGIPQCVGTSSAEPTVDCEADSGDLTTPTERYWVHVPPYMVCLARGHFPEKFMENKCNPLSDRGTELDWMRTFWDMHSYPSSTSFNTMMDWIDNAQYRWDSTTYGKLEAESISIGGAFDTAWYSASRRNGIDWP